MFYIQTTIHSCFFLYLIAVHFTVAILSVYCIVEAQSSELRKSIY